MGKGNEVDLVVRARNEASKTLKAITQAFEDFKSTLESANGSTAKGNTALGSLADTLTKLNQKAAAFKAFDTVAKNMDDAAKAAARVENQVRDSSEELGRMAVDAGLAARRTKELRDQLQAEQTTLKALKAERAAAAKQINETQRALEKAEAAQLRFNKAQAQTPKRTKGVGVEAGLPASNARDSASAFINSPVNTLRSQLTGTKDFLSLYDAEIKRVTGSINQFKTATASAAAQQNKLESETRKKSAAVSQERGTLAAVRAELEQVKGVNQQLTAITGQQVAAQAKVTDAYKRTAEEIERVSRVASVMSKFSTGGAGFADPKTAAALQRQNATIAEAEQNWKTLEAEARRLGGSLNSISGNATAQVNAFKQIVAASRAARAEYNAQLMALAKMQGSTKSSFLAFSQAAGGFRTLAASTHSVAPAVAATSTSLKDAARASTALTQSLRASNDSARQSLSLYQRMRGEVLSLAAGYIGLRGGAQQIMGVVDATAKLEAAQSQLNVAFNADRGQVAKELRFLEVEADRLGISFEVLSQQYSKFAVAARTANFSGEATRDIFLSIAEAGKVQRLSIDQLQGVFKALEQIISKGKVQAEELRGQLGDRMTGSFQIFAQALGVTTAKLDEMLKKGEVIASEETLSKLGVRLREIYGPELADALKSTNAEIGRFQNNLFQAQLRVGEGGFVEAFAEGLRKLNEGLSSREGRDFFLTLGTALAKVTDLLVAGLPYYDDLAKIIGVIVALKAAGWFRDFVGGLASTTAATAASGAAMLTWSSNVAAVQGRWNALVGYLRVGTGALSSVRTAIAAAGISATTAGVGFTTMRVGLSALMTVAGAAAGVFRMLWLAIGGLPGLILTGVTVAVGGWLTAVKDTTAAIDEHKRIMGEVIQAYDSVADKSGQWAKNIKNVTLDQAVANLRMLRENAAAARDALAAVSKSSFSARGLERTDPAQFKIAEQMRDLRLAVKAGTVDVDTFVKKVGELYRQTTDDGLRQYAEDLLDAGRAAQEAQNRVKEAEIVAKTLGDTTVQTEGKIEDLTSAMKKSADAATQNAEKQTAFNDAMTEMSKIVPSVAAELKRLEEIAALEKLYNDAVKAARTMGELHAATARYKTALSQINTAAVDGTQVTSTIDLIKKFEGFRPTPYWDKNAYRVGYGSDTVTLSDNSIQKVVQGMRIGEQDALRDLVRRIGEFQATIKSEIGADRFNAFNKQQQAALTSVAYNYGNLSRTGKLDTFKNGTVPEIVDAIKSLGSHNEGINRGRREQEAALFGSEGTSYETAQQQYELERKASELTTKRIADKQFEVQQQQLINDGKGREAAIEAAVREAKAENKNLTDEQIAKIRELAELEYNLKNVKTEQKAEQQAANLELQNAQALYQQQIALQAQFKQQQGMGDLTGAEQTRLKLQEVNAQFTEAVANARRMWESIGGEASTAAIAKLDTLNTKIATTTNRTNSFGLTANQVSGFVDSFASGIANAFGAAANAIANGENAFKAFGQAALQALAQIIQQIAVAILRMAILKALSGMGGGIGSAATGLLGAGVSHGGGTAGSSNRSRKISAASLATPFVYHGGGQAGLKSNEIVSVLERGETIRTEEQEAALAEKQAAAERAMNQSNGGFNTLRNIVTLDEESAAKFLTSATGEKAIWSVLSSNKGKLKGIMS